MLRFWNYKAGLRTTTRSPLVCSDSAQCFWRWAAAGEKSLHAAEQDTVEGKAKRVAWHEQIAGVAAEDLVFLDESGVTTDMTRRYGRAQRGHRIREGTPGGRWQTVTMLGAISTEGWTATMTVPAPTDSEVFLAYLNEVLCPALRPGQVVVMDNLAAHKIAGVAEAIAAVGARVL